MWRRWSRQDDDLRRSRHARDEAPVFGVTSQVALNIRSFDVPPVFHRLPDQVTLASAPRNHAGGGPPPDASRPRARRGRRHALTSVLLVAACAVLAGARSCLAIAQWARAAPQDTLSRLDVRCTGALGVRTAPSASTIRRVLLSVCPGGLADLLGHRPSGTESLAVDGKSARGSRTHDTAAAHLLPAVTGTGRTVTQLRVPHKTEDPAAPHRPQDRKSHRQASPQRIGRLARSQWVIENRSHHVRDTPCSPRTPRRSAPATVRRTWPLCGTWRSTPSAPQATPASPLASASQKQPLLGGIWGGMEPRWGAAGGNRL
ncbi:transposase family protein [Streptomyces sp. NPDC048255]|uniref:transposase family protein n=1 Tax=Streptomyces sp. NPDC048255 TaxID=3154713 RepID=UPI0033F39224